MKLVIFGLSVSSSWGNGHATLWRGLIRALALRGHDVVFFERDVPYYASHRDLTELPGATLVLYRAWDEVQPLVLRHLATADAAMVTSYCPDGAEACERVLASPAPVRAFYDMDTPITLERALAGQRVEYLPERGLGDFDVVLSYTGGAALDALRSVLEARWAVPLYGSVDPAVHRPAEGRECFRAHLSYLGTYGANRQKALEALLLEPARRMEHLWFVIGGAMYPQDFPWARNIKYVRHLAPGDHPAFYCSSALTLNVTRAPMAAMGHCPSGRLFEAAACGTPVLSDRWAGLDEFFTPGREILLADGADGAVEALSRPAAELAEIGRAARERVLDEHTADHRARELLSILDAAAGRRGA